MDKVKVSKEVKQALDTMFELGVSEKSKIIELHVNSPDGWKDHCVPLCNLDLETLAKALYIGYEVEQTPEDKVRERFENETDKWFKEGMIQTLDLLNIKIEGVNA